MAYIVPPAVIRTVLATNAVANTTNTVALLAAPGAGIAYRVVAAHIMLIQNATAGAILRCILRDAGGSIQDVGDMECLVGYTDRLDLVEPGIQLHANQPLNVLNVCSAANQTFTIVVYYFTDQV